MTWKKLIKHLDETWSTYYYAFPGEGLHHDGRTSAHLGLDLREGQTPKLRFPDGTEVTDKPLKTGDASGVRGISMTLHGAAAWVDLEQLELFDLGDEGEWSLL